VTNDANTIGLEALVDPRDREHVAAVADPEERATIMAALLRHRRPERLQAGDVLPSVRLHRERDLAEVRLADLLEGRPLVLVFGSYT
jgi:hypothetical protein